MGEDSKISNNDDLPHRAIFNDVDMKHFMESSTKKEMLNFVEALGKACSSSSSNNGGDPRYDPSDPFVDLPPSMASLWGSLDEMKRWVDDFPPTTDDATIRFGNPSFRQWHNRLLERSDAIITVMLQARGNGGGGGRNDPSPPWTSEVAAQKGREAAAGTLTPDTDSSIKLVSCYLHDAFGHAVRLDYGTGHESSFLVFLLVLSKVKCLGGTTESENGTPSLKTLRAVALSIFDQYLKVTRRLQTDYRLEPAGSHGVWGLDDYHCLPFFFGACQLQSANVDPHELTLPACINDEHVLKDFGDNYLYLSCIRYIRELKQGVPFFESSPMLYDISRTMTSWDKVARGLLRLYQGEVLDKRVVVQHFVFSKYFPATWTPSQTERTAPTETFRNQPLQPPPAQPRPGQMNAGPLPPTRAPWADGADLIPTRAPWAKDP
eukprot:CAMPEP_0113473634 /NCGR_PEP_ID=MMETSP0014_2-20120614/18149_1 /TAXON_ID=2857 /ORGANISM="Nitzschia sp." /LENGTH=433 /DNA_ID=CAMNT_0000366415 /DNA_START=60 /DNA_END=1361 /DNA_ORIENTATION=- /assembly_acc=CAM_ASM_000159